MPVSPSRKAGAAIVTPGSEVGVVSIGDAGRHPAQGPPRPGHFPGVLRVDACAGRTTVACRRPAPTLLEDRMIAALVCSSAAALRRGVLQGYRTEEDALARSAAGSVSTSSSDVG